MSGHGVGDIRLLGTLTYFIGYCKRGNPRLGRARSAEAAPAAPTELLGAARPAQFHAAPQAAAVLPSAPVPPEGLCGLY